jgi:hypothetical protein
LTLDHSSLIDEQEKTQEERESGGLAAWSEGANFIMVNFSHYKKYDFWQQLFLLQVAGKTILGSFASDL